MKMFQEIQTELCMCQKIKRIGRRCLSCGAGSTPSGTVDSTGAAAPTPLSEIYRLEELVTAVLTRVESQKSSKKKVI